MVIALTLKIVSLKQTLELNDQFNIDETRLAIVDLVRDRKRWQRLGEQGMIVLGRNLLPAEPKDDSPELSMITAMSALDTQVNNCLFLEEVLGIHLKEMLLRKNTIKHGISKISKSG